LKLGLVAIAALLLTVPAPPAGAARAVDVATVSPAESAVTFVGARPNPSHLGTTLAYALPGPAAVSLRLYNVAGRLVSTLDTGMKEAGAHNVPLTGRRLAVGTYFAVLIVDGQKFTRTVILQ